MVWPGKIIHDQWLSTILQTESYKLIANDELIIGGKHRFTSVSALLDTLPSKEGFIYAKLPVSHLQSVAFLEASGFNLVDTNLIFEKPIMGSSCKVINDIVVRFATSTDEDKLVNLARQSFVYSRFHLDPVIPNHIANTVKAEWVRNYFLGQRGEYLVVAEKEQKIVGFVQILIEKAETLVIDLIAVDKRHRQQGIASQMIAYAESALNRLSQIKVGTQIANVPSVRLYERLGFKLAAANYVFHYHFA